MKLEAPLMNLVTRCQTVCVPDCCGIDAYDFSPVHIASYLIMYRGDIDEKEVSDLKSQLLELKSNYGENGSSACGVTIEKMNHGFSGDEIESLVNGILANIDVAIELVKMGENGRYKNT